MRSVGREDDLNHIKYTPTTVTAAENAECVLTYRRVEVPPSLQYLDTCRYTGAIPGDATVSPVSECEDEMASVAGECVVDSVAVPRATFPRLIGRGGTALQQRQEKTRCNFSLLQSLPTSDRRIDEPLRQLFGEVVISSTSADDVTDARAELELFVDNNIHTLPFTHFISIPLTNSSTLWTAFGHFRDQVFERLKRNPDYAPSLLPDMFNTPSRLHLTLCCLRLYSLGQLEEAREAIREAASTVPLENHVLSMQGLATMQETAKEARVVYSKPNDKDGVLLGFCDVLFKSLLKRDLLDSTDMSRQRLVSTSGATNVKFHATFINARYAHSDADNRPYDATFILRDFSNSEFGSVPVTEVHLSRLPSAFPDSGPRGGMEYYASDGIIPFEDYRR